MWKNTLIETQIFHVHGEKLRAWKSIYYLPLIKMLHELREMRCQRLKVVFQRDKRLTESYDRWNISKFNEMLCIFGIRIPARFFMIYSIVWVVVFRLPIDPNRYLRNPNNNSSRKCDTFCISIIWLDPSCCVLVLASLLTVLHLNESTFALMYLVFFYYYFWLFF